ncbi:hypothetical protein GCM10025876_20160 [Demequina litorisediminis]|uniref:Uncharacterized protein n=1 Tax=Demequina litorisediminis TaxID=1849022 RepID=A0ABQ6IGF1_9MICO|nr:hypothetical protein GCM10025876_20160 [Demequina litorisediminis]
MPSSSRCVTWSSPATTSPSSTSSLLTTAGRAADALEILETRPFHPWEGGEGRALGAWDAANAALGRGTVDPPRSLGETRPRYAPPAPVREDGVTDYFATSLPDLLLFVREETDARS